MKRLILLVILFISGILAYGQYSSTILAHIHSGTASGEVNLLEVSRQEMTGDYVIAGEYSGSVAYRGQTWSHPGHRHFLMKIDSSGNHVWTETFGNQSSLVIQQLGLNEHGEIFLSGNFEDSISYQGHNENVNGFQPFMWKVAADGNFVFAFDFRSNPTRAVRPLFATGYGEVLIFLNAVDSLRFGNQHMFPDKAPTQVGFMARYDYQGNLINHQRFDSPDYFYLRNPARSSANEIVAAVRSDMSDSLFAGNSFIPGNLQEGHWFIKLDSSFAMVDTSFIQHEGRTSFWYRGTDANGRLMYTGTFTGSITAGSHNVLNLDHPGNSFGLEDGVFMVLNNSMQPALISSLGIEGNNITVQGSAALDGSYYLGASGRGKIVLNGDSTLADMATTGIILVELNSAGQLKHVITSEATAGAFPQIQMGGLLQHGPHGFAAYGKSNSHFTFPDSDTLITQSMRDGFVWKFIREDIGISEFPVALENNMLFPNPANSKIQFVRPPENTGNWKLIIYDISGNLVLEESTNTDHFDISKLKDGVYLGHLKDERNGHIGLQKLIVR